MCAYSDNIGLILGARSRLSVMIAYGASFSQMCRGDFGSTVHMPAIKQFLNMCIALLD